MLRNECLTNYCKLMNRIIRDFKRIVYSFLKRVYYDRRIISINLWYWMRYKGRVLAYPKSKICIYRHGKLNVFENARFYLGLLVRGQVASSTGVLIHSNGILNVKYQFRLQTNCRITVLGEFTVGNCEVGQGGVIHCGNRIDIGNGVLIAACVMILDEDAHYISYDGCNNKNKKPIRIEDNVWIGVSCVIHKGVTIGEGSVIAAGSVVTKDIPPHCLAAGVPAKVIRENITWHP